MDPRQTQDARSWSDVTTDLVRLENEPGRLQLPDEDAITLQP